MIYTESQNIYSMMRGEVNPDNQSTWDWEKIRDVNFLLSRAGKAQGDTIEINHYVGLARMFRAKLYYDKHCPYSLQIRLCYIRQKSNLHLCSWQKVVFCRCHH
jgi:hypothetical protein